MTLPRSSSSRREAVFPGFSRFFMRSWIVCASLSLVALAGCGKSEADRIALVTVAGKVTLDGKPLEGVPITFVSDGSNAVKTDGGDVTGSGGTFRAKYRNRDGLAPGKYKVVVGQPSSGPGGSGSVPESIANDPVMLEMSKQAAASKGGRPPALWPYGDAAKTPLSHEVSKAGDTDLTFDLKSTLK